MTSRNLYFKLLWEDLKRRSWAVALSLIGFFFAMPINLALTMENAQANNFYSYNGYVRIDQMHWASEAEKAAKLIELKTKVVLEQVQFGNGLLAFLMIVTAVVMGISSFSYLHNRRKVDFYHSLPVRRELMYGVQYAGGVLIIGAAYLLNLIFVLGVAMAYQVPLGNVIGGAFGGWLLNMLYFLLMYGVAVTAVMLTGHTVVGVLAVGVLFFFLPILVMVLYSYQDTFFVTAPRNGEGLTQISLMDSLKWISPFTAYLTAISWVSDGMGQHVPGLVIALLAALALAAFSLGLYRKRPSEAAGKAMAFKAAASPIRFVMVWGFGVMGAMFFWSIQSRLHWAVFGAVMGSLISHCVIEVIYHFDFRKLFSHWIQLIGAVCLSAALFMSFRYDWWGYDSWVPEPDKIESVVAMVDLDKDWLDGRKLMADENGRLELIWEGNQRYPMEHMALTDTEPVLALVREGILREKEGRENRFNRWAKPSSINQEAVWAESADQGKVEQEKIWITLEVAYRLDNGRVKGRCYDFGLTPELFESYQRICESQEYKKGLYPIFDQSAENLDWISYGEMGKNYQIREEQPKLQELLNAYRQDFLDLTVKERQQENPVGVLVFVTESQEQILEENRLIRAREGGNYDSATDVCQSWPVYPSFDRTIALLKEKEIPAGEGLPLEEVKQITVSLYKRTDWTLEEIQAVNSHFRTDPTVMVFDDPEEIELLMSAFVEGSFQRYNGLCGVKGEFEMNVLFANQPGGLGGNLQKNKITPQIEELFEGTGLFEE